MNDSEFRSESQVSGCVFSHYHFRKFGEQHREMKHYSEIIRIDPTVRSGKACIRNLRITVADVLGYLAAGMTVDEILADFPSLTKEDISASLAYAADSEKHIRHSAA